MKQVLSLVASFLALHASNAFPSPGTEIKSVEEFEQDFSDGMDHDFADSIRLIGYKNIKLPESERTNFENHYHTNVIGSNDTDRWTYYDAPSSTLRIYFPVAGALLKHGDDKIEANDKGEVTNLGDKDLDDYAVLGRKQTPEIIGDKGNIIKDGIIYLDPPVSPVRDYGDKIYVYDFGIKVPFHHHHHQQRARRAKRAWWNPLDWVGGAEDGQESADDDGTVGCYKNHGGAVCSKKFNIHHGRCKYEDKVCMDYNGPWTDCKNGDYSNFIGSDCSTAMGRGHCWNEVM